MGGASCCIQAYWQLGVLEGQETRNLFNFWKGEIEKGNITGGSHNYASGAGNWNREWGVTGTRKEDGTFVSNYYLNKEIQEAAKNQGIDPSQVVVTPEMRKKATRTKYAPIDSESTLAALNNANAKHAVFWLNTRSGSYANEQIGNHFVLGVKKDDGKWYNYDHCKTSRDNIINWQQVRDVRYRY